MADLTTDMTRVKLEEDIFSYLISHGWKQIEDNTAVFSVSFINPKFKGKYSWGTAIECEMRNGYPDLRV